MLHDINAFLACDIRASYIVRKSRACELDFKVDAKRFYVERWRKEFCYEGASNFLKGQKNGCMIRHEPYARRRERAR